MLCQKLRRNQGKGQHLRKVRVNQGRKKRKQNLRKVRAKQERKRRKQPPRENQNSIPK